MTTSDIAPIDWIPAGTRFGESDLVFFVGKGERSLDDVLADIDLVITGPHASAAFPEEMAPFVDPRMTRRLQNDFTDVSTSPVAQQWALLDRHVLYIENPHPRAVRDANRPRPADLLAGLREAFDRLAAAPGERPSLGGVDAVRPVTFGYLPVLTRPEDDAGWEAMVAALLAAGEQGVDQYERIREDVIDRVIEAKLRRLHGLDPMASSVVEWNVATHLDVLSIHDTMNHTARPDGAVCLERPPVDRLPSVVALSNRGDANGDVSVSDAGSLRSEIAVPTMDPARLRAIGTAYRVAFDAWDPDDVAYNRPYLGGHETQVEGPRLRALEPRAVVRPSGGPARQLRFGVWQNEFLREFLLGPEAVAHLMAPGTDWMMPPDDRVQWLAEGLTRAHDLVRRWGSALDGMARPA
jgi:hypothetical protein